MMQRIEKVELAVARIAAELTQRLCDEEGNPDDEYRCRTCCAGSLATRPANVDYSRKQDRDLARVRDGQYQRRS